MVVQIGPVPADSAVAYCELCRERLPLLVGDPILEAILTPDVLELFDGLLEDWERTARHDPFVWSSELPAESVEHIFFVFFQCLRRVYELFGDADPIDARRRAPFRIAMTNAVLNALEAEGKGSGQLARTLRESWPDADIGA